MTILPHFLVGSALGIVTGTPLMAFVSGFFSHFVLDLIPHLDSGTFKEDRESVEDWPIWLYLVVIAEFILTAIIVYFIGFKRGDWSLLLWGGLGGIAVDVFANFPIAKVSTWPFFKQFYYINHKYNSNISPKQWLVGLINQLIVVGGALWFLLSY